MKITCNGKEFNIKERVQIREALKDEMPENAIAAIYDNEVASLKHIIKKDGEIKFITRTDKEGKQVYIRGLLYLMSKAFYDVCPKALLTVNYQLTNSMFCEIDNMDVTEELIEKVKVRMDELVKLDLPIVKKIMTMEEAEEFYKKEGTARGRLQVNADKDKVSLYYCEDYYNYFYGTMPASTGFADLYGIKKFRNGFLVQYPSNECPNEIKDENQSLNLMTAMEEYDDLYRLLKINTVERLNRKIRDEKSKELILLSEALHEKKIAEIAGKIKERDGVRLILIAGPSSSGKTTFAGKLGMALRVDGIKPVTISVDNYFVERENNPKDELGNYDFECLEAIDRELLNDHILRLLKGEEIEVPEFDFLTGHKQYKGKKLKLAKDEVLVMEGIHCLNDKLTNLVPKENKFKIYISDLTVLNIDFYNRISTTDTRLIRRIVRDYNFRGYSAKHTLEMWYSVNRGEYKNIFPYQDDADCMFNSSIIYELAALKKYAVPLLEAIPKSDPEYSQARRLIVLLKYFEDFDAEDLIPNNSLIREFIGGSIFE